MLSANISIISASLYGKKHWTNSIKIPNVSPLKNIYSAPLLKAKKFSIVKTVKARIWFVLSPPTLTPALFGENAKKEMISRYVIKISFKKVLFFIKSKTP